MNRIPQVTVALITVVSLMLTGCSKRDKVISVAKNDPEMTAAIYQGARDASAILAGLR